MKNRLLNVNSDKESNGKSQSTSPNLLAIDPHGHNKASQKDLTINNFLERQQSTISNRNKITSKPREKSFAEKFSQFQSRDYQSNTRMNIKN